MKYADQLKHPNWQRKRLEALQAAGFECMSCGDKTTTLHVHHTKYIKGRMAWEYELDQLEVLCEKCHESTHALKEALDAMFVLGPKAQIVALVGGFLLEHGSGPEMAAEAESSDPRTFIQGAIAGWLDSVGPNELLAVLEKIYEIGPRPHEPANTYFQEMLEGLRKGSWNA